MGSSTSEVKRPNSPPSSPENLDSEFGTANKRRKTSPGKRLTNGSGSGTDNTAMMWMMGATLNSTSSAAREMDMVLKSEIAAHAAYDPNNRSSLHGVPVPGKKKVIIKELYVFSHEKKIVKCHCY